MASSNINKIVCGNLNLKPWILSKTPTDIVNSYVQRLYKQVPMNFRNDLLKPRRSNTMQRGVVSQARFLHTPQTARLTIPIVNKVKPKLYPSGNNSMPGEGRYNAQAKKLFRQSPNFRIYNTRRYASSASSSNASFHLGHLEEYRKKIYKPANGLQQRSYSGAPGLSSAPANTIPGIAKYIAPTRLFNEVNNQLKTLEVTSAICKDLMAVDKLLKEKIRVVRPKTPLMKAKPSSAGNDASLRGWNHPSIANMKILNRPLQARKMQSARREYIQPSATEYMSISNAVKDPLFAISPRGENARFQKSTSPSYYGATPRPYGFLPSVESEKYPPPAKSTGRVRPEYEELIESMQKRSLTARPSNKSKLKFSQIQQEPVLKMETWDVLHHSRTSRSPDKKKSDVAKKKSDASRNYGQSSNDFVCRSRTTRVGRGARQSREFRDVREQRDNRELHDALGTREVRSTRLSREGPQERELPKNFVFQSKAKKGTEGDSSNSMFKPTRDNNVHVQAASVETKKKLTGVEQFDARVGRSRLSANEREHTGYVPLRDFVQLPRKMF